VTTERVLAELPKDEALRLLASVPFGRVVFTARAVEGAAQAVCQTR